MSRHYENSDSPARLATIGVVSETFTTLRVRSLFLLGLARIIGQDPFCVISGQVAIDAD